MTSPDPASPPSSAPANQAAPAAPVAQSPLATTLAATNSVVAAGSSTASETSTKTPTLTIGAVQSIGNKRKHRRYLVKWRVAIVYEGGKGRKTFHGRVNEISLGGLSIHCDFNIFHEGRCILLLALPPLNAGVREKVLEITCKMNYTILSQQLFRIGLEFIDFRSGDRRLLEERLEISNAGGMAYSEET